MATGLYGTGVYGVDTYGAEPVPDTSTTVVSVVREVPLRLAITVTHADGSTTRWGGDEPDAINIPNDLTFSTAMPGGFRDMTCSLLRRIDVDYADSGLLDDVRVYGAGDQTAWQGRLQQLPRSHGSSFSITPGAVGHAAHLRDDASFKEVYVDRDLSHWETTPPLDRRIWLAANGYNTGKTSVSASNGGLSWDVPIETLQASMVDEAWYRMPAGLKVAYIEYQGTRTNIPLGYEAATLFTTSSLDFAATTGTAALTLDGAIRTAVPAADRYAILRLNLNTGFTPTVAGQQTFKKVAVYGNHGITPVVVTGDMDGILSSDIVRDVVTRAAPLLDTSGIQASTFPIAHMAFLDPVCAEDVIIQVNNFLLWDWGVYDNRAFFFRPPDDTLVWEARLSEGAHLDLAGDSAGVLLNGVVVNYTTPEGEKKTVGPPAQYWHNGIALADDTSAALVDASAENLVNSHNLPRKWPTYDPPGLLDLAGAIQLGSIYFAENSTPKRPGTLKLQGVVRHPSEGLVPAWRVRAGDYIRVADHPADLPRRIVQTSYSHGSLELVATLDGTPQLLSALVERYVAGQQFIP